MIWICETMSSYQIMLLLVPVLIIKYLIDFRLHNFQDDMMSDNRNAKMFCFEEKMFQIIFI